MVRWFGYPNAVKTEELIRLLVVDDDPVLRRGLRRQLERIDGVSVEDFSTGAAALARVTRNDCAPFHGALLDVQMPGLDGRQLARELRRIDAEIRVVFVTGSGLDASDLGHPVISKPWTREDIGRFVESVRQSRAPA